MPNAMHKHEAWKALAWGSKWMYPIDTTRVMTEAVARGRQQELVGITNSARPTKSGWHRDPMLGRASPSGPEKPQRRVPKSGSERGSKMRASRFGPRKAAAERQIYGTAALASTRACNTERASKESEDELY